MFLVAADDNCLRIYDLPYDATTTDKHSPINSTQQEDPFSPDVRLPAGELIYDFSWFPWATATDPATCCFAVTTRAHPIHLYDALSGQLRCSYRPYNSLDELSPAYSIAFSPDGKQLFAGGRSALHFFDLERPGREHTTLTTHSRKKEGQTGIISCIACPKDTSGLLAAGSYSSTAALYDSRSQDQIALLEGHSGGITHLKFSVCGAYLYSGARRDGAIYCWDARQLNGAVYALQRDVHTTNQRIYFDIEPWGRHLASGGEDGFVRVWDLRDGSEVGKFRAAKDTVNGCEFHPSLPVLATSSGQRRFALADDLDSDDDDDDDLDSDDDDDDLVVVVEETSGGSESDDVSIEQRRRSQRGFMLDRDENAVCLWRISSALTMAPHHEVPQEEMTCNV